MSESLFLMYLLFALTTGIYSMIRVFTPIIDKLLLDGVSEEDHVFLRAPVISKVVFVTMGTVFAPLFFLTVISETIRQAAIKGIYDGSKD